MFFDFRQTVAGARACLRCALSHSLYFSSKSFSSLTMHYIMHLHITWFVWFLISVFWLGCIPGHICCIVLVGRLACIGGCVQSAMLFAKARPGLETATSIPMQKVTTTLVSRITIALSCNMSRFTTVMAHNCIVVVILIVGVVVSAICWSAV